MQIPKALAVRLIARLAVAFPICPRSSRIPLVYVALVELEGFCGGGSRNLRQERFQWGGAALELCNDIFKCQQRQECCL